MSAGPRRRQTPAPAPALGGLLQALRRSAGISQEGWAARLGVGRRTVVRWEQGDSVPDATLTEALVALCQEKALFRPFTSGPLHGVDLNAGLLRDWIARARLAGDASSAHPVAGAAIAPAAAEGYLPTALTSFVGREMELEHVTRLLGAARLVTLTGAGGSGKTRLALEVAAAQRARFAGGVWLVELAALTEPEAVLPAIAARLGLADGAGGALPERLAGLLGRKPSLLVLDNCEHLAAACAGVAVALLRDAAPLTILATSRIPLAVVGEHIWRVPSLETPAAGALASPAELARLPSVRLFVERAAAVRPGFVLSPLNAIAVAQICRRLDGIPLALELAAARIAALSPEQVAARLDDRFALLSSGNRAALPRQQTLRALIDWSYDLLTPPDRRLFVQLSAFAGGCTLEAARAVCGNGSAGGDVLDTLARLVEHSLITVREAPGGMRYAMLETLRHYALERLRDTGEMPLVRGRHRAYYLALAEEAERGLRGPEQVAWLDRLSEEHDNLRAALAWSLGLEGDPPGPTVEAGAPPDEPRGTPSRPDHNRGPGEPSPEGAMHLDRAGGPPHPSAAEARVMALRLAGALWRFWERRGHAIEGQRWLARALVGAGTAPPGVRSKALGAAASLAISEGNYIDAARLDSESLDLARRADDGEAIATALTRLALVRINRGDLDGARALLEEGLALRRAAGDAWSLGNTFHNLAYLTYREGDTAGARALYEESLTAKRRAGDWEGIAVTLNNLGALAQAAGAFVEAREWYDESLALRRRLGDQRGIVFALRGLGETAWRQGDVRAAGPLFAEGLAIAVRLGMRKSIADCLAGLAAVAAASGQARRAAMLLGAVEALRRALGLALLPEEVDLVERSAALARAALGPEAYAAAHRRGAATPFADAAAEALGEGSPTSEWRRQT